MYTSYPLPPSPLYSLLKPDGSIMRVFRRQEAVDLLLGLRPLPVDANGNVSNTSLKEPLDLDRWASTAPAGAETADSLGADQEEPDRYTSSKRPLVTAGLTHDAAGRSESAVDVTGRSNGDNRCSTEGKSVSIRQGEKRPPLQRRRNGDHVEGGGMRGDHRGGDAAEAAVMSGGGGGTGENAVQRVTGAALAELRMAGPYSTLALSVRCLVIEAMSTLVVMGLHEEKLLLLKRKDVYLKQTMTRAISNPCYKYVLSNARCG